MSAHAKLAAIAATRSAMADLLHRIGLPDAPTEEKWTPSGHYYRVETRIPVADTPVEYADGVFAYVQAIAKVGGKRALVCAPTYDWTTREDGTELYLARNGQRFTTPAGAMWMAPRTLAPMIRGAMKTKQVPA